MGCHQDGVVDDDGCVGRRCRREGLVVGRLDRELETRALAQLACSSTCKESSNYFCSFC
jgi:hypothetical protein